MKAQLPADLRAEFHRTMQHEYYRAAIQPYNLYLLNIGSVRLTSSSPNLFTSLIIKLRLT